MRRMFAVAGVACIVFEVEKGEGSRSRPLAAPVPAERRQYARSFNADASASKSGYADAELYVATNSTPFGHRAENRPQRNALRL